MEIFISLDNSHIHLSKPLENWVISAFFPVYLLMLFDTSGPMEQPGVHQRAVKALQYRQDNSLQVPWQNNSFVRRYTFTKTFYCNCTDGKVVLKDNYVI